MIWVYLATQVYIVLFGTRLILNKIDKFSYYTVSHDVVLVKDRGVQLNRLPALH